MLGSSEPGLTTGRMGPQILPFQVKNGLSTMAAFVQACSWSAWASPHGSAWGRQRGLSRNQGSGGRWKPHTVRTFEAGGSRPACREAGRKESECCDMFYSLVSTGGGREQETDSWASPGNKVTTQPQFPLSTCRPRSLEVECRCVALGKGVGPSAGAAHPGETTWGGWRERGGTD